MRASQCAQPTLAISSRPERHVRRSSYKDADNTLARFNRRMAMPYGIMAMSLAGGLSLVVVLAAIGANIYWISMGLKLRHLLGLNEGVGARTLSG